MSAAEEIGRELDELRRKVETLERASQAQHSTIETPAGTVGLGDAAATAVDTAAALPGVEEQASTAQATADSVAVLADGWDDELDARLEAAGADLDDARADLEDSQQDIDDAFGERVDGLSDDVETAITAAGAAGQVANDAKQAALDAAGLAAGKGEVIVQVTAPSGSRANPANLWIDITPDANGKPKNTPNRYNPDTAKWEPVTEQKVIDAAAAAIAAQATADGKPLILFSTSAPSGTAPTGSIWFLWDSSNLVAGQWLQSGTLAAPVWTPQQIRSEVIANLDIGKLTAGSAAIADLVAQKIAASTANFQTANVSNLFVTQGATLSQAVIDFLFVNVVQAKKITADMIDVNTLNGITLAGVSVNGGTFTTTKLTPSSPWVQMSQSAVAFFDGNDTPRGNVSADPSGKLRITGVSDTAASILSVGRTAFAVPLGGGGTFLFTADTSTGDFYAAGAVVARDGFRDGFSRSALVRRSSRSGGGRRVVAQSFTVPTTEAADASAAQTVDVIDYNPTDGTISVYADLFIDRSTGADRFADTGWKPIPGVPSGISSSAYYRVRGGMVYLRGSFTRPNQAQFVNGYTPVGTLPAGARPSQYTRAAIAMFNGVTGNLIIGTDGALQVGASTGATADTVYVGGISFPND